MNVSSVGSQAEAVAFSRIGPSVSASMLLAATWYEPFPISVTAPTGVANAPPFLEIVTVGVLPVAPVM
jgi:hypothetical protein